MSTSSSSRSQLFDEGDELVDVEDSLQKSTTPSRHLLSVNKPNFTPVYSEERSEEESRLRRDREEEESLDLARRLMAEEAMASYQQHVQFLRESADQLSPEDFDALQTALDEEEQEQVAYMENADGELSYDAMVELGERIGDVKSERWAMVAAKEVQKLPTFLFDPSAVVGRDVDDDNKEHKCLVCQCEYEAQEELRRLPCGHCFHTDCVDQWLQGKDMCPYCRQCIIVERE